MRGGEALLADKPWFVKNENREVHAIAIELGVRKHADITNILSNIRQKYYQHSSQRSQFCSKPLTVLLDRSSFG